MDREQLVAAGLADKFEYWSQAVLWWPAIFGALAVLAGAYCGSKTQIEIPKQVAKILGDEETRLLPQSVSAWPAWMLKKHNWIRFERKDTIILPHNFSAFYHVPDALSGDAKEIDFLIKQGDVTVAAARTLTVGEKWSWPLSGYADTIEDGTNNKKLLDLLATTKLKQFANDNAMFDMDFVGIGLESSYGGEPTDELRTLSDRRGDVIAREAKKLLTPITFQKSVKFRTLGLGRSLATGVMKGEEDERRQRSIFLAAFSRLDNNVTQATIEESILSIVIDASELVSKVDLKNYEYSYAAKQRLSGGLVWNGGQPRDLPTLTVNDALAMRPKGTH